MSFARDVYTATEEQTDFTITFPYIDQEHVEVSQAGVTLTEDTDFTIVAGTTMRLTAEATAGDTVVIVRKTSQSTRLVDYATASTLTEEDLDNDSLQAFYLVQEAIDAAALALGVDVNDLWDAEGVRITEVGTPTAAADATTKAYVDEAVEDALLASGNLPTSAETEDGDVLVVTAEGAVSWAEMAEAYIPDGLIDAGMLAATTITEAEMANESITGLQLEDASVNEEHFVTAGFPLTAFDATAGTEGQVLKNEEGTSVVWGTAASAGLKSIQVFSTPGSFEYARPAGVTMIEVTLVGAGGGGGDSNGGAEVSSVGGGGGGGGTVISVVDVTNIATADIVVAAETAGAGTGADTTWTDGTNTFTAEGGAAGGSAAENAAGSGGNGGTATGTGTCVLLDGQNGQGGVIVAAGTTVLSGGSGSSSHGHGTHARYTFGNSDGTDAGASDWGAGGEGSPNGGANTTNEGGTGGSGLIIVREFGT